MEQKPYWGLQINFKGLTEDVSAQPIAPGPTLEFSYSQFPYSLFPASPLARILRVVEP